MDIFWIRIRNGRGAHMSRGGWEEGLRASERGVLIRGLVADVFLGEDEEVGPRCSEMEAGWPTPEFAGERCRIFLLLFFFFFEGLLLSTVNFF